MIQKVSGKITHQISILLIKIQLCGGRQNDGLCFFIAGVQGLEPRLTVPETAVLPLDDTPN